MAGGSLDFLGGAAMRVAPRRCKPLGASWWMLLGVAFVCVAAQSLLAKAGPNKALPPRVASVLRWLPEDTETLFVARSVSLTDPGRDAAQDWLNAGVGLASEELLLDSGKQYKAYDLRLMSSLKNVRDIPTQGKALVIVAAVVDVLHFRIFDRDGKQVVDTDEKRLPEEAPQFVDFRKQLVGLWPPHRLKSSENGPVITAVTSIVDNALFAPLRGRKIECIVRGARNYDGVSKMGCLRSEGCSIIVFDTDLGDAASKWTEGLRKGAKAVKTLAGHEVFVFPSGTFLDHFSKEAEWQGAYFVLLKPNTVLCASSDRYLESVLRRVNDAPKSRALPDNVPEWKQVDLDAPVWMLRHIPEAGERSHTVGSTAAFRRSGFRVVYVPKSGSAMNIEQIRAEWLPANSFDAQILRDQLKTVRQSDGTVVVSCNEKLGDDTVWFVFQLYWLQAIGLTHPLK
jgi:hypothetical protein